MNRKAILPSVILLTLLVITACYKDKFDFSKLSNNINWNPNLAVPAIHSSLTIRDLLQDYDSTEVFVNDQTGFLYLMYHNQVFSMPASNLVTIPDQSFADNFTGSEFTSQGFPVPNSPVTVSKNYTHQMSLGMGTDAFDSLTIKSATFNLSVTSSFLHTGSMTITFPTMKKNGIPYSKTVNINIDDGTFTYTNSFTDVAGYNIDLTNPTFNQIPATLDLTLVRTTGNAVIATHQCDVSLSFTEIDYSILWGNIGQRPVPVQEDTVNIKLFNNTINGEIYLMDPRFRLFLRNSFGVPLGINFNDFKIYSSITNTYNPYTFPPAYNNLVIAAPVTPGQTVTTTILLDTTNFPEIRSIISEFPRFVYLQTNALTNPPPTTQYNFITDTSHISVDLEVELPMWGRAKWWALQDTLDFNFSDYFKDSVPDLSNIDWFKFRTNITNGMPTEVGVQIYLTDTLYNIIDSIYGPQNMEIIASGILGTSGKVIASTKKISEVYFTGTRLVQLLNVKKALVRGYINTTNNGSTNVRFYEEYAIDVKVGVQIQAKFDVEHDF